MIKKKLQMRSPIPLIKLSSTISKPMSLSPSIAVAFHIYPTSSPTTNAESGNNSASLTAEMVQNWKQLVATVHQH